MKRHATKVFTLLLAILAGATIARGDGAAERRAAEERRQTAERIANLQAILDGPLVQSPEVRDKIRSNIWFLGESDRRRERLATLNRWTTNHLRLVRGVTNRPCTVLWWRFFGTVSEVQPAGVRVRGNAFNVVTGQLWSEEEGGLEYFVRHYPHDCAEGDRIGGPEAVDCVGKITGNYRYTTVIGGERTLRCLEFGELQSWSFPPDPKPRPAAGAGR